MKMAKKMFAIVMVLAMVAAFSAIAFAASPAVSFSVGDYANGKATVSAKFVDAVGLTSGSLAFAYPDGKVTKIVKKGGADANAIGDIDNAFSAEFNSSANPAEFGFYFKNALWSSTEWKEAAEEIDSDASINGESFEFAQFVFTAEEGTKITVTGELKIGETVVAVNDSFTIGKAQEPASQEPASQEPASQEPASQEPASQEPASQEPASQEPASQEPASQEPASQKPSGKTTPSDATPGKTTPDKTTPDKKTDGGKKTGDNGVLAVMAGVIALAGAAFVVTKKRK